MQEKDFKVKILSPNSEKGKRIISNMVIEELLFKRDLYEGNLIEEAKGIYLEMVEKLRFLESEGLCFLEVDDWKEHYYEHYITINWKKESFEIDPVLFSEVIKCSDYFRIEKRQWVLSKMIYDIKEN